jgi:fluoride exporter
MLGISVILICLLLSARCFLLQNQSFVSLFVLFDMAGLDHGTDHDRSYQSPNVETGILTHSDLGEFIHRLSLPSLTSLTVPHHIPGGSSRNSGSESDSPGLVSGSPHLGVSGSQSGSAFSTPSVTDREREESTSSEAGKKRLLPSQQQRKKDLQRQKQYTRTLHRSLPPPRTSSRRRSIFGGFDNIILGATSMSMENLHEVSSPTPVRRYSMSQAHEEPLFTPGDDMGNVPEISMPEPVDSVYRHMSSSASRRQSVVSQVRELANQQRRSRFSEVDLNASPATKAAFGTPRTYRDDTDDTFATAAPAPSISPSYRRSRVVDDGAAVPPSIGRSASRIDEMHDEKNDERPAPKPRALSTQLYIYSYLIFFSIFGTLMRLGLKALCFYPGAPVDIPVLWANLAGSFVLGFLLEDRNLFVEGWVEEDDAAHTHGRTIESLEKARVERIQRIKKTIPLYIGLATGFCGSLTSFSSFMLDAFLAMSNYLPTPINHPYPDNVGLPSTGTTIPRSAGYGVMALLAVIILNVVVSLGALKTGAHLAVMLDGRIPSVPFRFWRSVMDRAMVPVAWGCWIGALIMCIWPPDRPGGPAASSSSSWTTEHWRGDALVAIVLAPVGCIIRFQLALRLNGVSASFPLGTFAANVFATAVLGMAYDLQRSNLGQGISEGIGGGRIGCQVLKGIEDGFCGALSTVSTWVGEIIALGEGSGAVPDTFGRMQKRSALGRGYIYGLSTVAMGICIMVMVMGSVAWSIGWEEAVC